MQLRQHLARLKEKGYPWEHAFRHALSLIVWPHDKHSRQEWKAMIRATRAEWERAYHDIGQPIDIERMVTALALAIDEDDEAAL